MRSRPRGTLVAVALVAMVSLARADAPPDQYALFYSASLTIADNYTKLVWQRAAPTTTYSFSGAASYCQGLSLDGYADWRVPSYKELMTLVDEHPHFEYGNGGLVPHAIDPNAFPGTAVDNFYWTSSVFPQAPAPTYGYAVSFADGTGQQALLTQPLYVRCAHQQ
jgi:hypothetical protein